jgi:hypothetical protein
MKDGLFVSEYTGNRYHYAEGMLHSATGPACEYADGTVAWCLYGVEVNFEQWCRRTHQTAQAITFLRLRYSV